MPSRIEPLTTALRRIRDRRTPLLDLASEAADSGYWLALRVSPQVGARSLATVLQAWEQAHLLPITAIAMPYPAPRSLSALAEDVLFLTEMESLDSLDVRAPLVPAAARDAERFCREFEGAWISIDESVSGTFTGARLHARAEREKSFVRASKAAFRGVREGRIGRVGLWTSTDRVITACREAARRAELAPDADYEFCVPADRRDVADRLMRDGQTVRVWFTIDAAVLERGVAR